MIKAFLTRQNIKLSPKLYFVDAMGSMAMALFSTLLIGTIFNTVGTYAHLPLFNEIATYAQAITGAAIGVAIANTLSAPPLVLYSAAVVGYIGYSLGTTLQDTSITAGPAGAFLVVLIAVEVGKLVSKTTPVDILVTPCVTIISGMLLGKLFCPYIAYGVYYIGYFVNTATEMEPFLMGIIVSVVIGIVLTLPISSAAICAMIGIAGIAGGAATAGCCAQMIGFAVISFSDNGFGGLVAQGLGTSMLQMGNIVKKPIVWLPATLASAITGPISTMIFRLECTGVSAGMGTCGLVGPLGILTAMENLSVFQWIGFFLVCFILPAILSLLFAWIMKKLGWLQAGDLKLNL